jgi:hypothetical protein
VAVKYSPNIVDTLTVFLFAYTAYARPRAVAKVIFEATFEISFLN